MEQLRLIEDRDMATRIAALELELQILAGRLAVQERRMELLLQREARGAERIRPPTLTEISHRN